MTVYHWTTKKNAEKIIQTGLRQWSFVCRDRKGWSGEMCLAIEGLDVDWDKRDPPADWQAIAHEHVPPERCVIL